MQNTSKRAFGILKRGSDVTNVLFACRDDGVATPVEVPDGGVAPDKRKRVGGEAVLGDVRPGRAHGVHVPTLTHQPQTE